MSLPLTESTNAKFWQESGWTIKPLNIPVMAILPPAANINLVDVEPQDLVSTGGFELVHSLHIHTIDTLTHQTLLEQSLRQYEDIWRTLAER